MRTQEAPAAGRRNQNPEFRYNGQSRGATESERAAHSEMEKRKQTQQRKHSTLERWTVGQQQENCNNASTAELVNRKEVESRATRSSFSIEHAHSSLVGGLVEKTRRLADRIESAERKHSQTQEYQKGQGKGESSPKRGKLGVYHNCRHVEGTGQ